jgi:hypothetical protein
MRRFALVLAMLAVMLVPGSVAAGSERCSFAVTPTAGSPTDVYRITVSDVPVVIVDGSERPVEVQIHIRRLGTREGSVIWAFLLPGITEFSVNYPDIIPEEPAPEPLATGRYFVEVTTPHLQGADGCHAVEQFTVS